jgi:hypothetical protein
MSTNDPARGNDQVATSGWTIPIMDGKPLIVSASGLPWVPVVPCTEAAIARATDDLFQSGILDEIAEAGEKGTLDERVCMEDCAAIVARVLRAAGDGA